jgi:hypothetical protein
MREAHATCARALELPSAAERDEIDPAVRLLQARVRQVLLPDRSNARHPR